MQLRKFPVQKEDDFQHAFPAMVEDRIDGFMVLATPLMLTRRGLIAELAIKHRLPSVFGTKDNVLGGGLMSYAPRCERAHAPSSNLHRRNSQRGKPSQSAG